MEANETEGKIERFLNTQIVLNFKTVKQFAMLAAIFGVYSVVLLFSGSKVTGVAGGLLMAGLIGAPLGAYGEKIRRFLANVRFRVGKLQATGDGGEDYWTVLVEKGWIPFWTRPIGHIFKPFPGTEVTINCAGQCEGSVRYGDRPLRVLAKHEQFVVPIGHTDTSPTIDAFILMTELEKKALEAGVKICDYLEKGKYKNLSDDQKEQLTRKDFYTLMGLKILQRDGLNLEPEIPAKKCTTIEILSAVQDRLSPIEEFVAEFKRAAAPVSIKTKLTPR